MGGKHHQTWGGLPLWWFGTFFSSIYWVSNHPNWLSYFSEGWLNHQPVFQWIGWRENLNRKPSIFPWNIWSFPVSTKIPNNPLNIILLSTSHDIPMRFPWDSHWFTTSWGWPPDDFEAVLQRMCGSSDSSLIQLSMQGWREAGPAQVKNDMTWIHRNNYWW